MALFVFGAAFVISAYAATRIELLFLGVLLVALPLGAALLVRLRRLRLGVSRRFTPTIAAARQPLVVSVEVRNLTATATPHATWSDVTPWESQDPLPGGLAPLAAYRSAVSRGTSTNIEYRMEPPRRGIFSIDPLLVDFADPFSLVTGQLVVGTRHELVVTPAVVVLPDTGQSIAADEGSARALQRRASGGEDDLMTREYRSGDPLRRVHWRASAHHGELMVRQEEQRSHAEARILLDTRRGGYRDRERPTPDEPESVAFEWALAFAAALTLRLRDSGFTVQLVETGTRQIAPPDFIEEFLESLASVDFVDERTSHDTFSLRPDPGRMFGSVFAIVSNAELMTVDRLSAQRGLFDLAMAFIVDAPSDAAVWRLQDAGWICIDARSSDNPVDVWLAAAAAREAHFARA
jgi:uncharacterized protein (DUF58 family)